MKKLLWYFNIIFLLTLIISCSDSTIYDTDFVAGEFFTNSSTNVVVVDTNTIYMSTIKFDSIITSSPDRMLVGKYTDPVFGEVKAANYMGFIPSSYEIDDDARFDSIIMFLDYDEYYYNDTTLTNTIHIRKLTENFDPDDDDYFYNTSTVKSEEDEVGFAVFSPRPFSTDSLEIRLNDDFGLEFFEKFQEDEISTYDEFAAFFKGLTFQPDDDDNGAVIGFTTESIFRLYYSISDEDDFDDYYIDFSLNTVESPNPLFNQISSVNAIEDLQTLTDVEVELDESDSNNQTYMQSGVGIATKLSFPFIETINNVGGLGTILEATLKIYPVIGSYSDELELPESLLIYTVDKNNDISGTPTYFDGSTSITATLNTDEEEFGDIYYEVTITSFIEEILTNGSTLDEELIFFPSDYTTTVDRTILNGITKTNYTTTLELTYAVYDDED
ncbi:DUF4270 domain-containing protein [Cellulophaga baltica]|uniref:DUF4270 family protein n=1 Tax=Cellulophaga TaxID=104264 RepID=UPI001C069592|nr:MULTISPECIES: DUF4270 family protein [Cellulophaga]MBU2997281.1 DUF4270 domain-containing protein [Cellulophaga baltica]MDO6768679.1 DUF4270 family protein [Cellulophaga sp. 1_MG-2023]